MPIRNGLSGLINGINCTNAGLALDKYLRGHSQTGEEKKKLLANVSNIPVPAIYKDAFKRWENLLSKDSGNKFGKFKVVDRLIVGLGGDGVLETGITLHHTYGVPYIPGSALKGLMRHYLMRNFSKEERAKYIKVLFGDNGAGGYITFYDALYIPGPANSKPLHGDVITPHHQKYYTTNSDIWPTDFDDPIPVPFISASGSFLIAIKGPNVEWTDFAFKILTRALAEYGIGGKTSSGYGRLVPEGNGTVIVPPITDEVRRIIEDVSYIRNNFKGAADGFIIRMFRLSTDEDKIAVANELLKKLKKENIKRDAKGIPNLSKFYEFVDRHGLIVT